MTLFRNMSVSAKEQAAINVFFRRAKKYCMRSELFVNEITMTGLSKKRFFEFLDFDEQLYPKKCECLVECPDLLKTDPLLIIKRTNKKFFLELQFLLYLSEDSFIRIHPDKLERAVAKAASNFGLKYTGDYHFEKEEEDNPASIYLQYEITTPGKMKAHYLEGAQRMRLLFAAAKKDVYEKVSSANKKKGLPPWSLQ